MLQKLFGFVDGTVQEDNADALQHYEAAAAGPSAQHVHQGTLQYSAALYCLVLREASLFVPFPSSSFLGQP